MVKILNHPFIPSWSSSRLVQAMQIDYIQKAFSAETVDIYEKKNGLKKSDDRWIIPYGKINPQVMNYLKCHWPEPKKRPPIIFFWNGEGAKLGYSISQHRALFGPGDRWVVPSLVEKNILDFIFPGNQRTSVMYFPVGSQFRPVNALTKKSLRKKWGVPENKKTVIYAGRLSEQKNLHLVLKWLSYRKPNYFLLLAGEADEYGTPHLPTQRQFRNYPNFLNDVIENFGLLNSVRCLGQLSQNELSECFQLSDFQISLSTHYGEDFGYSVAQGLCCGLPSILTSWGGQLNWAQSPLNKVVNFINVEFNQRTHLPFIEPEELKVALPPKRVTGPKFRVSYEQLLCHQLADLTRNFHNPSNIEVRPEVHEFWNTLNKRPRTTFFNETSFPMLQILTNFYRGHRFK